MAGPLGKIEHGRAEPEPHGDPYEHKHRQEQKDEPPGGEDVANTCAAVVGLLDLLAGVSGLRDSAAEGLSGPV